MKSSKVLLVHLVGFIVFCSTNITPLPQEDSDQILQIELGSLDAQQSKPSLRRLTGISKLIKKIGKKENSNKNEHASESVTDTTVTDTYQKSEQNVLVPISNQIENLELIDIIGNSTQQISINTTNDKGNSEKSNFWVRVPLMKNILGRTCFKDIGCFSAYEYQDMKRRPIPILPMAPELIDPTFHIFSPKNQIIAQNFSYNATSEELKNSMFDPQLNSIFITHGFRSGFEPWIKVRSHQNLCPINKFLFDKNLKESLFNETKDFNIVCVNWEKGAKVSLYHMAATNARVVGALTAFFITTLVKTFGISNDKFYLIGHSVGAHVVGYAGKRLNEPQAARITGLDPSGPGFHFANDTMRLHYKDATFVDAFHTDIAMIFSDGLGVEDQFGHFDFYPNGGMSQPGCKSTRGIYNIIQAISTGEEISCSHSRAHRFATNIGMKPWSDCQTIGYECVDYETFIEGRCFDCRESKCQPMGLNPNHWLNFKPDIKTLNYKYYLNLAPTEDFCVYHYQFAFHLSQDSDESTGTLDMTMSITAGDKSQKQLNFFKIMSETQIGEIHTLLMTFQFKLQEIKSMTIEWKRLSRPEDKDRVNKGKRIKFEFIEINYMSHLNQSFRDNNSFVLCAKNGPDTEIRPNSMKVEYIVCPPTGMLEMAQNLVPEILVPLTRREDLFSNDYERLNSVVQKVAHSNLQNKTKTNYRFLG